MLVWSCAIGRFAWAPAFAVFSSRRAVARFACSPSFRVSSVVPPFFSTRSFDAWAWTAYADSCCRPPVLLAFEAPENDRNWSYNGSYDFPRAFNFR